MRNFKVVLFVLSCLCGIHVQAQQLEIKGVVTSSDDKQPLIGATVSVKGAPSRGVVTDMVAIPYMWSHRIKFWLYPMSV